MLQSFQKVFADIRQKASNNNTVGNAHDGVLDQVTINVDKKLRMLPTTPPEKSIFKVPNQLREVNEKAYEPQYVAIGPYHYGNDNSLRDMDELKGHFLNQMLRRRGERTVDRYVQALKNIEDDARQQYDGIVALTREEFREMMLLDGCFIIELFRKRKTQALGGETDRILSVGWFSWGIQRDLLLLENQLPFLVLVTLYDLMKDGEDFHQQHNLIDIARNFFSDEVELSREVSCCKHLLDLVYQALILRISLEALPQHLECSRNITVPFTATKLKGFGIKFIVVDYPSDRFDFKFKKGTLEIPRIIIGDDTEPLFRNLIAYEHHCPDKKIKYVTDYVSLLDSLVDTPKDVELFCRHGIIENYLGDDEAVSNMLNKMSDYVPQSANSYYASMIKEVNKHCTRWNRWGALLLRDHCHSPWAFISICAAVVLLLLTLIQAINSFGSD